MLKKYQQQYTLKNVQFILTDVNGTIIESDDAFFNIAPNTTLFNIHPFFECFHAIQDTLDTEVSFNCVHLNFDKKKYITDIKFKKEKERILVVVADYTSHYILYQEIAQTRNESIINGELIAIKNAELEEREKFKNEFIRNFSHELRNPLTSIISITKILENTILTTEQQTMIDFLNQSNANLKLLLDDILSISLISSGRIQLRESKFSLDRLFELILFTYTTKASEKGLEFILKKEKKIPDLVEGDRLRLFQVITNLLDNAIKYTKNGSIKLEIKYNQKRANKINLRFEITDTGIGINDENKETIFESFSQLNNSSDKQTGIGLGLPIVKGLLTLMGSEIKLDSTPQKGSIFYFDIALKQPLATSSKTIIKEKVKKKPITFKTNKKYKLLLVEDDINVQTVLFKLLLNTNHFYIDFINDGGLVMEQLINNEYDIILMDINLPTISGDQIAKLIRDFPFKNIKNIPIVGITAYYYADDVTKYKQSGINAIVSKPFDYDDLLQTIIRHLK